MGSSDSSVPAVQGCGRVFQERYRLGRAWQVHGGCFTKTGASTRSFLAESGSPLNPHRSGDCPRSGGSGVGLGPGVLTEVGELHSLTDWQVSEASEDAELEDFCCAEVSQRSQMRAPHRQTGQESRQEKKSSGHRSCTQWAVCSRTSPCTPLLVLQPLRSPQEVVCPGIPGHILQTLTCPRPNPGATYFKAST